MGGVYREGLHCVSGAENCQGTTRRIKGGKEPVRGPRAKAGPRGITGSSTDFIQAVALKFKALFLQSRGERLDVAAHPLDDRTTYVGVASFSGRVSVSCENRLLFRILISRYAE